MSETFIDYDAKVQDALRGVVRTILRETAEDGLQGDHHFYIAFKTQAEGVDIPGHLKSRFPEEMTIVLQHKFWGLKVEEDYFEVGLSFNQTPEMLKIPFSAVVGFVDPSVQFALQFHDESEEDLDEQDLEAEFDGAPHEDADNQDDDKAASAVGAEVADETGGDNVVTLDAFRKK
ncbi:SspB family protein [Kordiimonas lipolytica]|uniref:SspB family protein n=1 Tax=Kordiimonas lipolytica TaxID=1662421 RepID=A0ABV8UA72_9PROT|nr:ClpXP protease specificity-enhancing factor SspB [Kordiimonas lipolytica]